MKIHNFTLCDLVRQENTGKFLLIGAYTNEITFQHLPTQFDFSVWMLIECQDKGHHTFAFRATMRETDTEVFYVDGGFDVTNPEIWTPFGFGLSALLGQTGTIVFEAKLDNEEWFELRTVRVKRGDTSPRSRN